jgi:Holliday junction DNA helicase RuvA
VIGYLRGRLLQSSPETVLLDVGGVGYEVHVTVPTFVALERSGEEQVALHVHTHLKEDGIALYGFATEAEKRLFEKLLGVTGIGPRLARVILSGMAAPDLVSALKSADTARLARIPGVGRKTSERLVLELRDRLEGLAAAAPPAATDRADDAVSALVNLGYKPAAAQTAVAAIREETPEIPFEELLRKSLKRLSRA